MARSFYGENKRVSNARLKAAGYAFLFPDYRTGLELLWAEGTLGRRRRGGRALADGRRRMSRGCGLAGGAGPRSFFGNHRGPDFGQGRNPMDMPMRSLLPGSRAAAWRSACCWRLALASETSAAELAKTLFGAERLPAAAAPQSFGFYSKGCFAGGVAIATDGPNWQAMRLSRNRRWGHPTLIKLIEKLSADAAAGRLARPADRRHLAAARRPDADRPCLASDRPRRRHLAEPDAAPPPDRPRARDDERRVDDPQGRPDRRRAALDPRPSAAPEARRVLSARSSASSSIRASRRSYATPRRATAAGCARCGRSGATTTTSTSASAASRVRLDASASRACRRARAATSRSPGGSPRSPGAPTRTRTHRRPAT